MILCICGHRKHAHDATRPHMKCDGADQAINRNWCDCAGFKPASKQAVIDRQVERYRSYWFWTEEKARAHVERRYASA